MTLISSIQPFDNSGKTKDDVGLGSTWSKLDGLHLIEEDVMGFLTRHEEGFSYNTMVDKFDGIKAKLTLWMESAHLAIFTVEQKVNDGALVTYSALHPLQTKMAEMETLMAGHFGDIGDWMDEKFDDTSNMAMYDMDDNDATVALATKRMAFKMGITKLQSEWSGLHHFMASVTKQVESANEKRELLVLMETIMLDIDDLTSTIFEYQEKRHLGLTTTGNDNTSLKDETLLANIDQRVKPVFQNVENVYTRMNSTMRSLDEHDSGILVRKHRLVQEKWECLRIEIDGLKDELKEDRWLSVFRQVADQVDAMINGLNKTVQECYSAIQQIIDWYELVQQQQQQHYGSNISNISPSSPHSPSAFDKISKTFLRSFPRSHQSSASGTSSASGSTIVSPPPPPPLDRDKLRLVEKNFEDKNSLYTPSIDRMLSMLGNGIASRVTKDDATCKRQSAMVSQWQQLKATINDLRMHDLPNVERYLVDTPHSPASSIQSDRSQHGMWRSIRRRTSNQDSIASSDFNPRVRSASTINGLPRMNLPASQHEDYRRVRSVTPSSGSKQQYQQSSKAYNRQQRTTSPLHFSSHPSSTTYHHNSRIIRPSTSESSSLGSGTPSFRPTLGARKSLTPTRPAWNTSIKPDKPEFSSLEPLWKGETRAIASRMDDTSTRQSLQQRKSHVPRPPSAQQQHPHTKGASFMKPTKSTILRKRSSSVEPPDISRPKTPTRTKGQPSAVISNGRRTKTPTSTTTGSNQLYHHLPPRPKSSLARQESHDYLPYVDRDRYHGTKSPIRRSGTPSLIPRPKTPTTVHKEFLRSTSPSAIPRPRSSLRQANSTIPPVPSLPRHLERPSIHLLKVGSLNKEDICENGDHDDGYSTSSHSPCRFPDSSLPVPSLFNSHDTPPHLYQQQQHIIPHQHSLQTPRSSVIINAPTTPADPSKQQRKRELLKKRSMPALAIQRSGSPFQSSSPRTTPAVRTTTASHSPSPHAPSRQQQGYYSEDDDEDQDGTMSHDPPHPIYTGDPRDPLDMEVATILNASPIAMHCQKSPQGAGKYLFGNEMNPTVGKKLYTCKLISYNGRRQRQGSAIHQNKVLVRVGGGKSTMGALIQERTN
ncbi:hypothetical protein [Absidia glauca]|uniref:GAR domain-containing protein n=1 Tax=Absidia glauca TaxID=4829 RepID=A0A168P143_ABSGL|nr:hypothetical protein [Absidia glauca]